MKQLEKKRLGAVESDNERINNILLRMERKQKQNNLIIFGLPEKPGEVLTESIVNFVDQHLGIELKTQDINNTYRITTKGTSKGHSPLVLELTTFLKKREIMQQKTRLKGTHIVLSDDLPKKDRIERKLLYDQYTSARRKGYPARLLHNKVEINGVRYTYSDLCRTEPETEKLPNTEARCGSAPSTPTTTSKEDRFNFSFATPLPTEAQQREKSHGLSEEQSTAMNTRLRTNSKSGIKTGTIAKNKAPK